MFPDLEESSSYFLTQKGFLEKKSTGKGAGLSQNETFVRVLAQMVSLTVVVLPSLLQKDGLAVFGISFALVLLTNLAASWLQVKTCRLFNSE